MARENKNHIARLKEENEDLKKNLRRAEYSLGLATDTSKYMLNRLQSDNENLKELNERLHDAVRKMVCRNAELRRKLKEQKPTSSVAAAQHCELIAVCGKQKEEIGRLNKQIAKLKDEIRIEKDGRKGLFQENERLKKVVASRDDKILAREDEIDTLNEKVKDLEAKAIEDQQGLIAAYKKIEELERVIRVNHIDKLFPEEAKVSPFLKSAFDHLDNAPAQDTCKEVEECKPKEENEALKATIEDLNNKIRILVGGLKNDLYNKLLNGNEVPKEFIKVIANASQKKPDCDGKTGE